MLILQLNHMTGKAEYAEPVAYAATREALLAFVEREQVEPYQDGQWGKYFRRGGPLEWFNPPPSGFFETIVDIGTQDDWANRAREQYQRTIEQLMRVD